MHAQSCPFLQQKEAAQETIFIIIKMSFCLSLFCLIPSNASPCSYLENIITEIPIMHL